VGWVQEVVVELLRDALRGLGGIPQAIDCRGLR
jgi:hypothetical protein